MPQDVGYHVRRTECALYGKGTDVSFWAVYSAMLMDAGRTFAGSVSSTRVGRQPKVQAALSKLRRMASRIAIPSREEWVRVRSGIAAGTWLRINVASERNWWSGAHESVVQQRLRDCVAPGIVLYDVGAHIGFFSLAAARLGAVVVAFEADPENAVRMRTHVQRNGLVRAITLVEAAVWSRTEPKVMFRRGLPSSQGGVSDGGCEPVLAREGPLIAVDCTTIDDFVAAGGPAPDVIKIDVEGGEAHVLKGAIRSLGSFRPMLMVEVHNRSAFAEVEALLTQLCYALQWHVPSEGFPRQCFAVPHTAG